MYADVVDCPSCERRATPNLFVAKIPSSLRRPLFHHVCPLCGAVMYISGGTLTPLGRFTFHFALGFLLLVVSDSVGHATHPILGWTVAAVAGGFGWRSGLFAAAERLTWTGPLSLRAGAGRTL